jgi:DinB superfamily
MLRLRRESPALPFVAMTDAEALHDAARRLANAGRELSRMRPEIEGRGPWPLEDRFDNAPEASWGPPELLAHVAEMIPYWLGEIERILDGDPRSVVPFGRVAGDDVRLAIIGRDRSIPIRELLARIAADARRTGRRLEELGDDDAARRGLHPRLGEMALPAIAERFLATHAEEHVVQLGEILAAAG